MYNINNTILTFTNKHIGRCYLKGNHCPISGVPVDSNCIRLTALLIFACTLLYIVTLYPAIILFILIDFFIRAAKIGTSPLASISKFILSLFKIARQNVDAAPKLFASRIGLLCCIIILLSHLINSHTIIYIFSFTLLICAFLESFFNYCVGCKIYSLINYLKGYLAG
ncbi:MAG TPA: hypothetical protein DF296_08665 [Candidatus Margulisbacteria bacterium]|nr:hypothetical protein [Candidatus Margulisiibacteriota bacterium]